ncbi:MAG: extracellular solute-binding protein, partial [Myxococcota bacterium]|nr:extracellular solute-binding protein [Myxococcota bacterium]
MTMLYRAMCLFAVLGLWACPGDSAEAPQGDGVVASSQPAESPAGAGSSPPAVAPTPAPSPKRSVVLWHAYRGQEKEALEQAITLFHASQDRITVRLQAVPYDPYVDKIAITIPRGQGPDVFIFAHNMIGAWVEEGLIEPLSTQVKPELLQAMLPQSVRALVYQQHLYGLPLAFKSLALFYDKSKLPKAPATMEELLDSVKELQRPSRGIHGLVYEAGLLYHHAPWMHAFGGAVFDEAGAPALNTPAQVAALDYARSLHAAHKVVPKGMTSFMLTSLFNDGKAIAVLNGPWFRAEITAKSYGVAPIPTVGGRVPKPFLGVEAAFVSS